MFYCKNCGGKLYEDDIFKADDDVTYMEIGCYNCPKKIFVPIKRWNKLKKEIEKAIDKKRATNKATAQKTVSTS